MRLVLFDLDGTVLTFEGAPPGPGRTALDRAVTKLFGVPGATDGVRLAGGTDRALARALLRRVGADDSEAGVSALLEVYVLELEDVLRARRYRPVGDVARVVAACRERGAGVGIATGNVRRGARLKLGSAGLSDVFDLERGGYGCDAEERAEVLRAAVRRCAGSACEVVVVGDTEKDVAAARAIGARIVGVAISTASRAELAAAGADAIVDTCGDELVRVILG
jgi:phosphoglycolate phosphatase-like HAD superfamily hydrolase